MAKKFYRFETSSTSTNVIAELQAALTDSFGGDWTITYASSRYTVTGKNHIGDDVSIIFGYGGSTYAPKTIYIDTETDTIIAGNDYASTSANNSSVLYNLGINGMLLHNNSISCDTYGYAFNGLIKGKGYCGNKSNSTLLSPLVYFNTTTLPNVVCDDVFVTNDNYHTDCGNKIIDKNGTMYMSVAQVLYVKYDSTITEWYVSKTGTITEYT